VLYLPPLCSFAFRSIASIDMLSCDVVSFVFELNRKVFFLVVRVGVPSGGCHPDVM